jgi:hypothetical protein
MQGAVQQAADWHPASGVVGAGWPGLPVGAVRAADPRVPPCCVRPHGMCGMDLNGAAVLPAVSQPRAQHHASRPAACWCRSAACSGHYYGCWPCPFQHSHACTAAQQLHPRALQPVFAVGVGGAFCKHDYHITLMIMPIIGGHAPMPLLSLCLTPTLCSVHPAA